MTSSILVVTPAHLCDAAPAIAAVRAGEIGLLDLGLDTPDTERATQIDRLVRFCGERPTWGLRWDTLGHRMPEWIDGLLPARIPWLVIAGLDHGQLRAGLEQGRALADRVLLEVYDSDVALAADQLPCDGLVLKGLEAGGRIGATSSFLWLQRIHGRIERPYWVQGAWGTATAAAAYLAGAAGIVLGEELWLTRESPIAAEERERLARLDGSETVCLGPERTRFRLFGQTGRDSLTEMQGRLEAGGDWPQPLYDRWLSRPAETGNEPGPQPMGQGVAFAARLASRYVTVGGVLEAFRTATTHQLEQVIEQHPLSPGAPLARDHDTRYPVLQGPMTRVSDVSAFCDAVSRNGALPFLALALMRGPESATLLTETKRLMGERPWGVGILGFVPAELRQEQLKAIEATRPRFAIIAGGRPSQARALEQSGIATYIHVPSPGLLASFVDQGARRFIFEGRECGGHVGPRTALTLWQSAIDVLLDTDIGDPGELSVVFAGGIHDALSSAMVQTLASPLVERGVKVGVLMGTAYLFTHEAVNCGAITPVYQEQAMACRQTALLASGVGHATRCAATSFSREFDECRRKMLAEGRTEQEIRFELEMLNLGRLRIASKGLARLPDQDRNENGSSETLLARGDRLLKGRLAAVGEEVQRRDGMYMIGEVATLRDRTVSMTELHEDVCCRGTTTAAELARRDLPWRQERPARAPRHEPIAIIGMACHFPQSPDPATYWKNIVTGFDAVREVPAKRWSSVLYYSDDRGMRDRICSKWGSFLDECRFNPLAYGIPPASVPSIEPIQLLSLDVASRALGDAGYETREFNRERTAVIFAAGGVNDLGMAYVVRALLPHYMDQLDELDEETKRRVVDGLRSRLPEWTEDSFPGFLFNVVSGRVANRLDLKGSNFIVDAACAASLAALQTAVDQLRAGTCDMALVGAADATNNPFMFTSFAKTHALTPGGKIRPFDDRADGIVLGEGVGAVVIKRLSDAQRDGDRVYALVRGIGSSSDGRNRSLTAPHPESQRLAIQRALEDAAVDPASVSLIEAHATGTAVGDRAEIAAMRSVFETADRTEPYCALGSVKSNIGHTKTAAGMAGLIKTVLALQHRVLPPTINVEKPNAKAGLDSSPFYINTEARPWIRQRDAHPRRAGLSAFGFGGTNFHVVLEENGDDDHAGLTADLSPRPAEIFAWKRADMSSLFSDLEKLETALDRASVRTNLGQLAHGVQLSERRRRADGNDAVRLGIVACSVDELRIKIRRVIGGSDSVVHQTGIHLSDATPAGPGEVCFLFPGQGSQHPNMLKDLVQSAAFGVEPIEHADRLLDDLLPRRLSSYIYPRPVFDKESRKRVKSALDDTRIAQPAIGLMSVYACDVLTRFGLLPAFAAGHSYGEHVALSAMGLLSRDDLLRSSAIRGRAVHEAGRDHPGGMAAVAASEEETRAALDALGIPATIANVNAPRQVVIAGPVDAIDAALKRLPERGLAVRRVAVTAAFHSASMEQPSVSFGEHLEKLEMHVPRIPVYSNINAEPYPADVEAIRKQMSVHLARPVRFVDQIRAMHRDGARIFFEVGPGRILTGLVKRILEGRPHVAVAIDRPADSAWQSLGELLAQAHAVGLPIDLTPWFEKRGFDAGDPLTYLSELRAHEVGRPTDWIVDSSGARPPGSLPEPERQPAIAVPPVTGAAELGEIAKKMNQNNDSDQKRRPQMRPEGSRADPELLRQLNDAMSGWLELQKEQQRLGERFLALQERIVAGMFGDAPPVREARGIVPDRDETVPGLAVPPAPVLPDLRPVPTLPEVDPEMLSPITDRGEDRGEPAPAVAVPPTGDDGLSVDQFRVDLLAEISRRTGYPEDMLDLDVPLEGGLGIDSIKTMEVFGALKKYHAVLSDEGELDEDVLVQLSQFRTLREFLVYYGGRLSRIEEPPDQPAGTAATAAPAAGSEKPAEPIERLVLRSVPAPRQEQPRSGELPSFPPGQIVLVLGEPRDLASSFDAALSATGHRVVRVVPGKELRSLGNGRFETDLSDPGMLRQLAERIRGSESARVGVLVNLLGLADPLNRPGLNGAEAPLRLLQSLTNVAQVFEEDLRSNADGKGWLINVTSFDGRFGLRGLAELPVAQASSLGFFKSVAREWRDVRVKNLDLDPAADPRSLLAGLLQEMAEDDDSIEVGLDGKGRWHLELVETPREVDAASRPSRVPLPLDRNSVVLATGGADGITAEVVKRMARESGSRMVIVGRTAIGAAADEPAETRTIENEQELRDLMIRRLRAEHPGVTPAEVEQELQSTLKQRRIRSNLEAIRAAGSEVEYHSADVRNEEVLGALIDSLYARLGRIDGVLHGAGVVEDCRLRDKTPESLTRVFRTKAGSAHILARKLQPETLRFLVFFSSVSGRFGNAGQTDYSAANEYLNKLASHLDRQWPGRIVAVNWGPWDGGMVAAGLRAAYTQRGIGMIGAEQGARSLLDELCLENSSASEVVLTCTPQRIAGFDEYPA